MPTKYKKSFAVLILLGLSAFNSQLSTASAQGTAFTYQGRLNDGANPASGVYDLRFAIYDSLVAGTQQGNLLTNSATAVSNGLFTVTLDFGNQFPGASRWLEISVRTNGGGSFFTLSPRQPLTPAPYAITAGNVVSGGLTSGTYGSAVTFSNANNSFSGSFTGNGSDLTNVNAATLNGLNVSSFWQLGGNTVSSGQFLGSLNNLALDFYTSGVRALRLILRTDAGGTYTNAPNVIGGSSVNQVSTGVVGGTVGGGGGSDNLGNGLPNTVTADFGTVSGGSGNSVGGAYATVSGGNFNTANGSGDETVGGGGNNTASGLGATVSGGQFNTASGDHATVAGGGGLFGNTASGIGAMVAGGAGNTAGGDYAAVAGGNGNTAGGIGSFIGGGGYDGTTLAGNLANSKAATIGGGLANHIPGGAAYAFIGGGDFNTNSGTSGTLSGGEDNTVTGDDATVPGGQGNFATGKYSFAAGHNAVANLDGCFVWEDDHNSSLAPAVANFFLARCTGGAAFVTGVDSDGNSTSGVIVHSGDTSWSTLSDRNAKKNVQPVDGGAVLEKLAGIPVEKWNYKWEADTSTPHLGPMAQDFKTAFYPGRDDKSITTLEFDGVELAAIQGLNEKVEGRSQKAEDRIQKLEAENAELQQRLVALEKIILNQKSN